ncbi:MAG: class II histone deacetylase [Alphaproteobacteria bacterium]|nr:class II histone deacetylase [Alphaproteobacteria bacterium]
MKKTGFFYDERCMWHVGQLYAGIFPVGGWVQPSNGTGLAEAPDTKRRLKSLMDVSGLLAMLEQRSAKPATETQLMRIHPQSFLHRFKLLSEKTGGDIGHEASFGHGGYEIAKISAGLAIAGIDAVIRLEVKNAYILSRPPGHHCLPDQGMGFCLLANIPLAIEEAIATHKLSRIAVLDWDVHHGNGTEAIYLERADVLTISIHQENCFPIGSGLAQMRGQGKGLGYNLNIPLLPGSGDQAYRDAFELLVKPALRKYKPELIIVASGLDANALDPLARMMLHSESYRWMTTEIMALADEMCSGRLAIVHEGGYSESYVPFCGQALIEQLAGMKTGVADPALDFIKAQQPNAGFQAYQRGLLEAQAKAAKL